MPPNSFLNPLRVAEHHHSTLLPARKQSNVTHVKISVTSGALTDLPLLPSTIGQHSNENGKPQLNYEGSKEWKENIAIQETKFESEKEKENSSDFRKNFADQRSRALGGLEALRRKTQKNNQSDVSEEGDEESLTEEGLSTVSTKVEEKEVTPKGLASLTYTLDPDLLLPGDFVVHYKYGISKFLKFKKEIPAGKTKPVRYVYLQFADGEAKVSAKEARKVLYKFAVDIDTSRKVRLSKLKDTTQWEKKKSKGQQAIRRMVVEMMELHVQRLKQTRPRYAAKDDAAMAEFAASFPYKPTPDQEKAFQDVEEDMRERDVPMDRLICGDVGFGKTEVAMRAIFQAVLDGRQVMVLAPTTVLAKQHYNVISSRFQKYSHIRVELLSRFQKESEKREIGEGIREGSLDIVVGTHALLGSRIQYHNLGLLIVDEEQRFGVRQKEQITALKSTVDVLTLSATPIPRTLYMALNGFRDASLILTPPPERRPIVTHVCEQDEKTVETAIHDELSRGGQVFYVVPRVQGIEEKMQFLLDVFPDKRMDLAHGQQSPDQLEEAMDRFLEGSTHVLLCTSIIESGIDISSCNTIVIEDVHLFGLAQLYQLRGRVGRSNQEAHAYMLHPPKHLLSEDAKRRLAALEEFAGLGQGFQLAERDMAIRGVGSIFGEKQSGDTAQIGLNLYMQMLHETLLKVEEQRLPRVEFSEVQLDLEVDCHIPREYVPGIAQRDELLIEAEIAASQGMTQLLGFTDKLRDTYGEEPPSVEAFLKTLYVRRIATDLGVHRIYLRDGQHIVLATTMNKSVYEMLRDSMDTEVLANSISFSPGQIEILGLIELSPIRQLERIFRCLIDIRKVVPLFIKYM